MAGVLCIILAAAILGLTVFYFIFFFVCKQKQEYVYRPELTRLGKSNKSEEKEQAETD